MNSPKIGFVYPGRLRRISTSDGGSVETRSDESLYFSPSSSRLLHSSGTTADANSLQASAHYVPVYVRAGVVSSRVASSERILGNNSQRCDVI